MNKHKIAWIALAAGIVFVIMLTWLVGVSPQISHIKSSDAQTAQIDENNKETRDEIETLRIASETIGLQKDRLRQLQRQIPDGYNPAGIHQFVGCVSCGNRRRHQIGEFR